MRKPKTGVCFTFHVGTRVGKLYKHQGFSPTGTFISSMALTTLKSYNFGFMLISLWKQLHSTPKRQTLLVLSVTYQTGRRRNGWNIYCLKYNQSSKLRKTNVHLQKKKIKTIFFIAYRLHLTQTPDCGMFHLKTVHIAVPFNPNASFLFLRRGTQKR